MKWLKYTFRTVVTEQDMEGNPVEREIFTEACVPDNESGRTLAEMESYDGVITEYDDGLPEPVKPETDEPTFDDMAEAIKEGVNEV